MRTAGNNGEKLPRWKDAPSSVFLPKPVRIGAVRCNTINQPANNLRQSAPQPPTLYSALEDLIHTVSTEKAYS